MDAQLKALMEKRNESLRQWRSLYDHYEVPEHTIAEDIEKAVTAYDACMSELFETFSSSLDDQGRLLEIENENVLYLEEEWIQLLREIAERNKAYIEALDACKKELKGKRKEIHQWMEMGRGYSGWKNNRDATYLDRKV